LGNVPAYRIGNLRDKLSAVDILVEEPPHEES
jgi:hypothetical protein